MFDWLSGKNKRRSASDYSNEEWLEALEPPRDEEAIAALRAYIVRGLRAMLSKRVDAGADAMAEDHAQDALLKILDNLQTFRGEQVYDVGPEDRHSRGAYGAASEAVGRSLDRGSQAR